MKKIVTMLLLVAGIGIQAQNSEKAEQLLNQVSDKVSSYENMVIDFKYSLENTSENIHQETRGDASIKGDKYRLNFMGTTQLFDGEKVYTIIPEDEEINISNYVAEDENNITPSKMFTFYENGYTFAMDESKNINGRSIQFVKLTPKDSNAEVKKILLGIDKQTKNIYNLIQTQPNGTTITITVKSFKTNQSLPEKVFMFDESRYSNYYINRLD